MGDNKEKLAIANKILIVIFMLFVFVLIAMTLLKGFTYFEMGQASANFSLALFFIAFLWLNGILILLKLEQVSLRDRMIDPILVRRLSNILVFIAIAIFVIIILLVVRVFFATLLIQG